MKEEKRVSFFDLDSKLSSYGKSNYDSLSKPSGSISDTIREEAIPLIIYDVNQKSFYLNPDAEEIISKIESPLGVISVAGMYRTGKSYLLNRMLLNRSSGFSVGPSINPCTKGLWVWSKSINGFSPSGEPVNVLIIDTEGIGATDEDQNHDSKIFTLGLLLSSYFVYNSLNSIDENAIQNLSFIVNVSKNIQLSANQRRNNETDTKDLSLYLPSFLWVIRDFALKLVDPDGNPITAKDYLEKSLESQKGFSDSLDQKNKIRQLLKDFFKERNCITLVRPLTKEENLQNLERMDLSQLRPEFSEQVNNLRKMVLKNIRPKTLNGQVLNGAMFCSMIKSYMEAINQGAVPVIENAWGFMCKNECLKAMKKSIELYEKLINENCSVFNIKKVSQNEKDFNKIHKEAKDKAIEHYKRFAIGNYVDEFLAKLKEEIKEKYNQNKSQNEKECEKLSINFLNKNYAEIEKNIKQATYKSYSDFKIDVEDFIDYFKKAGPQGPNREIHLNNFILRNVLEASELFYKQNQSEIEILNVNNTENIKKLSSELKDLKSELEKEINAKNDQIKKLEKEKNDLIYNEKNNKENMAILEKEREQINKNLTDKLEVLKKENEKQIADLKEKLAQAEELAQDAERRLINKEADFSKQKSLLEQKVKFAEKQIDELSNKEKDFSNELKSIKKEREVFSRDSKDKFEAQIKTLNNKIEELQDKNIDLETKLLDREKRSSIEKMKYEENISELKKRIEDFNSIISSSEEDYKIREKRQIDDFQKVKVEYEFKIQELNNKIEDCENKIKEQDEKLNALKTKNMKEISILNQNLELTTSSFNEFKIQAEEEKNTLQAMIRLLEDKNHNSIQSQEDYIKQINELKNNYFKEIKTIEEENEKTRNRLNQEIEDLKNKYYNCENEKNYEIQNLEKEAAQNTEKIAKLEELKTSLQEKLKTCEAELERINSEYKLNYESLDKNSQNKIEEILKNTRIEIEENNHKNEKLINEMQKYFEAEKANCEYKLNEEKEKFSKKLLDQEKYYMDKYLEIEETKNKKIEELEEELSNLDSEHNDYVIRMEQDVILKNQQIETLQKFFNEQKENFVNLQNSHKFALEKQLEHYNNEKAILLEKSENMIITINKLEKHNSIIQIKKEYLEEDIAGLTNKIEILQSDFEQERNNLKDKIKTYEDKYQAMYDKLLIKTGEFSREVALKNQEVEFLEKKNVEQQIYIDLLNSKNEENLRHFKENLELEYYEKFKVLSLEKEDLESKLMVKKREYKELETDYMKDKSMLEKEKAVLNEKLFDLIKQKDELIESIEKERELHKKQSIEIKETNKAENEMKIKENEFLKNKLNKIEQDSNELMSNYDKDRELWTSKNKYLEDKLTKSKFDLTESNKKYEQIIQLLQKQGLTEKEKFETWQNIITSQLEGRYTDQIKQFKETYAKAYDEVSQRKKELETDLKILHDKLQNEQKNKLLDQGELGRRLNSLIETENILKKQIEDITMQKDSKIAELAISIAKEREVYKLRMVELENKCREYESKRSNLAVDNLKDKVVFDKDKENLQKEIETLKEKMMNYERTLMKITSENKDLIRENDRLKRDNRNVRSTNFLPKFSRYATNSKDSRNPVNTSFDKSTEGMDFLKNLSSQNINFLKNKYATRSEKSEEENISNLSNL